MPTPSRSPQTPPARPPAAAQFRTALAIEEALSGWSLPLAAVGVLAVGGVLHFAGFVSESAAATVGVITIALAVGLYLARPALDPRRDAAVRGLSVAAALLTLAAVALPALATVHPGQPLAAGELTKQDDTLPLPPGLPGRVRVLVSGALSERGEPAVSYTLGGTDPPVEGRLERTFSYARVGRSGRTRVAHDRLADMVPARLAPGAKELRLDQLQGQLGGPLHVTLYREPLPFTGGPWILAVLATVLAALVDAKLTRSSEHAVAAGMAVAFGLLVTFNATPDSAVGPVVGGIVLGAMVGALAGWIVAILVRRFAPPPGTSRKAASKGGAAA